MRFVTAHLVSDNVRIDDGELAHRCARYRPSTIWKVPQAVACRQQVPRHIFSRLRIELHDIGPDRAELGKRGE
jgi:hypothetical protein